MNEQSIDFLLRFNRRDPEAFSEFHRRHYPGLFLQVLRLVGNREDARDIVADLFEKLWRIEKQFDKEEGILAYCFVAARNSCVSYFRVTTRHEKAHRKIAAEGQSQPAWIFSADQFILDKEVREILYAAIMDLPPKCQEVFKLILRNLTPDEIGKVLGISTNTVYNHRMWGINRLRAKLPPDLFKVICIIILMAPYCKN